MNSKEIVVQHALLPSKKSRSALDYLFDPNSIAVIGASNDTLKPGGRLFKTIQQHHFDGALWPVNPKAAHIMGVTAYPSVAALPGAPELAIVAIPAAHVLPALQELADKGTGAAIVLTSGFGEKNEQGKALEQAMLQIARSGGMTLVGPNCSGFLTKRYKGKFAGMVPQLPGAAVDFISGSGATVDYLMEQAVQRGLSFGNVVNLGNSVMVGVEDLLAMYDDHYERYGARVLLLYMESIRKPGLLLHHARNLAAKGCTLVGIKSGATAAGERAAASHTGALASPDSAVSALFEKAGIIRVKSKAELIDVACVLVAARGRLIRGNRACIITDAGGPGVMLADELSRQGWQIPPLSETTLVRLREVLPAEGSALNPIDYLPSRTPAMVRTVLQVIAEEESARLDAVAVITGDPGLADNGLIYDEIVRAMESGSIPVLPVIASITSSRAAIDRFIAAGKVYFYDEVSLGAALAKVQARPRPAVSEERPQGYDRPAIAAALAHRNNALSPECVRKVLSAAGFRLPPQREIFRVDDLGAACRTLGFPLVMKVIGPLHKSDVGGVRLGIGDEAQALEAWRALMEIPEAAGVLLQPMIAGLEVILGAARKGDFGHLIMFGLGGIHAEVLKDVRFALAPLSRAEALDMIRGIRAYPIVQGVRGQAGLSIELLSDQLIRLGHLVCDFPEIDEIDLNPVKGVADALFAVDARMLVGG
jgi:acyl-CoA synthetase (NDP forming)